MVTWCKPAHLVQAVCSCSGREGAKGPRPGETKDGSKDPSDGVEDALTLSCLTDLSGGALFSSQLTWCKQS